MAAKPSTAFTWATDATYTGGTEAGEPTKTAPSPTKRAEGWEPAEEPASETLNHALNHLGQWTEYVNDGDLDGPITITGDLNVTGSLDVDTNANVDGTLVVDGNVTAPDFRFTTARSQMLPASSSVDPNGTHTKLLGASSLVQVGWTLAASANKIQWPLELEAGSTITGWTVYIRKRTDGSANISARLFQTNGTNGVESTAGLGSGDSDTTNAPGYITLTETGLSAAITSDTQYYLVFTPGNSVTPAADELLHAVITYTRP